MLYPYKCIDCVYCNESEHKCYPKSRDCKNEYDLTDEDMYQMSTARCDFYRPKKVEIRNNMSDREKVFNGLEKCIKQEDCENCPYANTCDDPFEFASVSLCLLQDTLILLKEQEGIIKTLEDKNTKLMLLINEYLKKEREAEAVAKIDHKGGDECIEHEDCRDCPYINECDDPYLN